jgi:hypothetical protein
MQELVFTYGIDNHISVIFCFAGYMFKQTANKKQIIALFFLSTCHNFPNQYKLNNQAPYLCRNISDV